MVKLSNNLRAVFFDMDGVIFDSMPHHAQAWDIVMAKHGLHFTAHDCYLQEGRTGQSVIDECYMKQYGRHAERHEWEAVYDEKTQVFHSLGGAAPIPHIHDVLLLLKERGVETWIVTGSGQESLFADLNRYFPGVFCREKMVTALDVTKGKPDPEPYLKAWLKSGFAKEECMIVENAPLGIMAGKAAGLYTVGVNTGILTPDDLLKAGADKVLTDMQELYEMLAGVE